MRTSLTTQCSRICAAPASKYSNPISTIPIHGLSLHLTEQGRFKSLSIGSNVHIARALCEPRVALNSPQISDSGKVFLGSGSYMNGGGYIRSDVFIGQYNSIGRRVTLAAGRHGMSRLTTSPAFANTPKPIPYTAKDIDRLCMTHQARPRHTIVMNDVLIGDARHPLPVPGRYY